MARSGQSARTAAVPRRAGEGVPAALISDSAAAALLARAVRARMGALLAADAQHPSATLRSSEAGVFVSALADLSGRTAATVSIEVEKRALARIRAVEEGADLEAAEREAAGRPMRPAEDTLNWRQAEVLRTLTTHYNASCAKRGVMPGVRAEDLIDALDGRVPKTVVRSSLKVLREQGFAGQIGASVLWTPTALGGDAVSMAVARNWYFAQFDEACTLAEQVEEMLEQAAESRHLAGRERGFSDHEDAAYHEARAAAWIDAAALATGSDPDELARRVDTHLNALERNDRERQERVEARQLKNTIVDANDQLHPRELEVLRTLVASYNRSVSSWNQTMRDAGLDAQIAGRRVRDLRISPDVKTDQIVRALEGRVSKSVVRKALTRLHETGLISYRFDGGSGGYWVVRPAAFRALGVDPVEFDEHL